MMIFEILRIDKVGKTRPMIRKLSSLKRIQPKESFEAIIADLTVRFIQEEIGLKLP
jgi:hypothetical protein